SGARDQRGTIPTSRRRPTDRTSRLHGLLGCGETRRHQSHFVVAVVRFISRWTDGSVERSSNRITAKRQTLDSDPGVLAASGMITGEGLAGVLIAFLVAASSWFEVPSRRSLRFLFLLRQ